MHGESVAGVRTLTDPVEGYLSIACLWPDREALLGCGDGRVRPSFAGLL